MPTQRDLCRPLNIPINPTSIPLSDPLPMSFAASIDRDGYAIEQDVLDSDEVEELKKAIAAIPETGHVRRRKGVYGIRNLLEVCPAVVELSRHPSIVSLVESAVGSGAFAVRATLFDKADDANWSLGWHQDSVIAVVDRVETDGFLAWSNKLGVWQVQPPAEVMGDMLAMRVHLDPSLADNGPLRVLPGSHRHGWLDHEIDQWRERVPEVICEVSAGGVVGMRPLLLHASGRSAACGDQRRRVIHIEFAKEPLPGKLRWHTVESTKAS